VARVTRPEPDRVLVTLLALITAVLVLAALHFAQPIAAPVAFALFTIAVVWPLHRRLAARLPQLLALALTLLAIVVVVGALGSLVAWGVRGTGQWLVANAPRLHSLYQGLASWLEQHGIYLAGILTDQLNTATILGIVRQVTGWLQGSLSFALLTLVFVMLGLLEVEPVAGKLARRRRAGPGPSAAVTAAEIAAQLQRYMLVRTGMSSVTGLAVWAFAGLAGLELAGAWGVIAFALNYIPFLGPLVATLFPTLLAIAQFDSLAGALLVFLGLQVIQFLSGSYIEPRVAGRALALCPFMVLLSVFLWYFLWGVPGAFIGVPILIAVQTICAGLPALQGLADLLGGPVSGQRGCDADPSASTP
jgi:predicted PurR-regulated permease PerM